MSQKKDQGARVSALSNAISQLSHFHQRLAAPPTCLPTSSYNLIHAEASRFPPGSQHSVHLPAKSAISRFLDINIHTPTHNISNILYLRCGHGMGSTFLGVFCPCMHARLGREEKGGKVPDLRLNLPIPAVQTLSFCRKQPPLSLDGFSAKFLHPISTFSDTEMLAGAYLARAGSSAGKQRYVHNITCVFMQTCR